jgi:hypothetical protein
MIIQRIGQRYIQRILDEKNAEAFQRDLAAQQPRITHLVEGQQGRLAELEARGATIFINVTLRVRWQTDVTGELGGGTAYMGLDVERIEVSTTKLEHIRSQTPQRGFLEGMAREAVGSSEELMSFSFSYPDLEIVSQADPNQLPPPNCFIATACYGSPLAPEVCLLREFRDMVLQPYSIGRAAVKMYYRTSPPLATFLKRHKRIRMAVRFVFLSPMVAIVRLSAREWRLAEKV